MITFFNLLDYTESLEFILIENPPPGKVNAVSFHLVRTGGLPGKVISTDPGAKKKNPFCHFPRVANCIKRCSFSTDTFNPAFF